MHNKIHHTMKKNSLLVLLLFPLTGLFAQAKINTLSAEEKAQGFKLLFNGKDLTGWRAVLKDVPPEKGWVVESDGSLHVLDSASSGGRTSDLLTVGQYKSFELKFDFKLTEGANSGVKYFVTESPQSPKAGLGLEYQVLDDERHPDAKLGTEGNRTLASLYDLIPSTKTDPRVHRNIGEWNEGKIVVMPNNIIQHWLNGVKVVEYERGSGIYKVLVAHSKFAKSKDFGLAEKTSILLQQHGDNVFFRNIKIREISK